MWHKPKHAHTHVHARPCSHVQKNSNKHVQLAHIICNCLDCGSESSASTGISWTPTGRRRDARAQRGSTRPHHGFQGRTKEHLEGFIMWSRFVRSELRWKRGRRNDWRRERSEGICAFSDSEQMHKHNTVCWLRVRCLNRLFTLFFWLIFPSIYSIFTADFTASCGFVSLKCSKLIRVCKFQHNLACDRKGKHCLLKVVHHYYGWPCSMTLLSQRISSIRGLVWKNNQVFH